MSEECELISVCRCKIELVLIRAVIRGICPGTAKTSYTAHQLSETKHTAFVLSLAPRFILKQLLPIIAPGLGVTAFFCFMFSWVEVVFARILTVTAGKPITMAINALYGFRTDIGLVMAMTLVSLIPGLAVIYFVRNHIAKGFFIRS